MNINIIVAATLNNVIGGNGKLLWRLPNDMKYFKKQTLGHAVIMGRKTYEAGFGKSTYLKGRTNIVLSREPRQSDAHVSWYDNINAAIQYAKSQGHSHCFVIGGQQVYELALPMVSIIFMTRLYTNNINGDVYFPKISTEEWQCIEKIHHKKDNRHFCDYTFEKWTKKK